MSDEQIKEVAHLVKIEVVDKLNMGGGTKLTFLDYLFHELAEDEEISVTAYVMLFAAGMIGIHDNEEEEDME